MPNFTFETKARTLDRLTSRLTKFKIPDLLYFTVAEWRSQPDVWFGRIAQQFGSEAVIVRSSAWDEDGSTWGQAGQYASVPGVGADDREALTDAVDTVVASYEKGGEQIANRDEIIVQRMLVNTVMSGVLFTQDLNTGAPYYVINYDDQSGRTDTVTSGAGEYSNRTLYLHRGAIEAVRSPRFQALVAAVSDLEAVTGNPFLDVEFALDADFVPYLLQVRLITTRANWNRALARRVDQALLGVQEFVRRRFQPLPGVLGARSVFGQMPDWNPAEMIGRAPRRLASSLYRKVITDDAWRDARQEMGYAVPEGHPLMVLLAGQPYVDVRLSFHSYLPATLDAAIGEKLVNAWLERLVAYPHLHDKVEFEVAITAYSFDFSERVDSLIPDVLSPDELAKFETTLRSLTREHVTGLRSGLESSLARIKALEQLDVERDLASADRSPLALRSLLERCVRLGTVPFSILARHGFIARSLLLSLVSKGVFSAEDANRFGKSIRTVASEIVADMRRFAEGRLDRDSFMAQYGHLRPGTYDILSPRYDQALEIFSGVQAPVADGGDSVIEVSERQRRDIDRLLAEHGFDGVSAVRLLNYLREAPAAREHAKFVFTRTLSDVLELTARYGEDVGLSRDELSHLAIDDVLEVDVESAPYAVEERLRDGARRGAEAHATTRAVRLPQLLFDEAGVHVVPFQISHPNFITHNVVRGTCVRLRADDVSVPELEGRVVLIEGADPGFDWIFAHRIGGLVTAFGGANSHMAIRCAEFGIPAAIGCGEQVFERVSAVGGVELNCGEGIIRPVRLR